MTVTKAENRPTKQLITPSVAGMTCMACERQITKALLKVPGVISASASTRNGTASLIVTTEADVKSIERAVVKLGYRIGGSPWINRDPRVWRSAGVAAALVAVFVWVLAVGDFTGRLGDLSTGGLLLVLALGLAAGVSTCMAMVGGIVLALSAGAAGRSTTDRAASAISPVRVNLTFQAGRIAGSAYSGWLWVLSGRVRQCRRLLSWH